MATHHLPRPPQPAEAPTPTEVTLRQQVLLQQSRHRFEEERVPGPALIVVHSAPPAQHAPAA